MNKLEQLKKEEKQQTNEEKTMHEKIIATIDIIYPSSYVTKTNRSK